jgi:putative peptide zinc metalloprotease protein
VIEMVKQLSPVIRADGYHILADLTGVPDLYAHIGPTLRQLLPGRHEPSALHGRARAVVTVWVLVVVPALVSMSIGAILVLPRLAASAWESGRELVTAIPAEAADADVIGVLTAALQLLALALPVLGCVLLAQHLVRSAVRRARAWSAGSAPRGVAAALAGVAVVGALAWAWWPDGQYRPVRGDEDWTLAGLVQAATPGVAPAAAADTPPRLAPGRHLAIAMIPRGGATERRPALYVIRDKGRQAVAVVSTDAPAAPRSATAAGAAAPAGGADASTSGTPSPGAGTPTAPAPASSPPTGAPRASGGGTTTATAFPFKLPDEPRPGDTQALATGKVDGGVTYDIAYAVVTVKDGADVTQRNGAYALASCKACITVAVSFQVVLVVGQSDLIAPVNVAEALNVGCPYCITAAFAHQMVISLTDDPSPELLERLQTALERLDALPSLGPSRSIATELADIQRDIDQAIDDSGLRASAQTSTSAADATPTTTTPATSTAPATSTTPSTGSAPASGSSPETQSGTTTSTTPPAPPPAGTAPQTSTTPAQTTPESAPPPTTTQAPSDPAPTSTTPAEPPPPDESQTTSTTPAG